MKAFTLTLATILFIGFLIPTTCNAQTHRLLSKIEETKLGNNIWDKVTVMLPNKSYTLSKVSYEKNTLLVLFDYTQTKGTTPTYFTFNLSDYKIDSQEISEKAAFQVVAKNKLARLSSIDCPPNCLTESGNGPVFMDFRCPSSCPF